MKLLKKIKIKNNNLNTELKEMGVFSAVAGDQLPNQLQKRGLPALFHLRCPSQSHQRSARGRTRLTTVTSISCRSFQRQLLYLFSSGCLLYPSLSLSLLFTSFFCISSFSPLQYIWVGSVRVLSMSYPVRWHGIVLPNCCNACLDANVCDSDVLLQEIG